MQNKGRGDAVSERHDDTIETSIFDAIEGTIISSKSGRSATPRDTGAFLDFVHQYNTIADVWQQCPRSDWMLWLLEERIAYHNDRALRLFACWCTRQVWPLVHSGTEGTERCKNAVEVAERFAHGKAMREELTAAWDDVHAMAIPAATGGMRHRATNAAAVLACWHTANPKAFEGGKWASWYAVVAARWRASGLAGESEVRQTVFRLLSEQARARGESGVRGLKEEQVLRALWNPAWDYAAVAAEHEALTAQADKLRELLGNPFAPKGAR